ncbi:MAG: S8 family serine peptidase [Dehalococcoidia bacterium]
MKARISYPLLGVGLVCLMVLLAFGQAPASVWGEDIEPAGGADGGGVDVIVVFQERPHALAPEGADRWAANAAMDSERAKLAREVPSLEGKAQPFRFDYRVVLNGVATTLTRGEMERVRRLPYVESVSEDLPVEALLGESVPLIQADRVWTELGATGEGVTIAIIDTGIDYTHPDLGACSPPDPETGFFAPGCKVVRGEDFINGDKDPMDDHGHGTYVAGIAAGNGGITGVAPDASLLAYKVLGSGGSGAYSAVIAGVEQAVEDGADVMNLSLGGPGHANDPVSQAVNNAVQDEVVAAIAAGNSGPSYFRITSPGAAADAITVGATDKTDGMWSSSSSGPANYDWSIKPDVVAPGVDIESSVPMREPEECRLCDPSGYREASGTSAAAPHVAGAAALLLQLHPGWSPAEIEAALTGTAVRLDDVDVFRQGAGRIDAYSAATTPASLDPASLDMGIDYGDSPEYTAEQVVILTNRSDAEQIFTLDVLDLPDHPGISVDLDPPGPLTIPQGGSEQVTVTLTVDNSQVPFLTEPPYAYEGWLSVVDTSQEEVRAPIVFIKGPVFELDYDEVPFWVAVDDQDVLKAFVMDVPVVRLPLTAGTYNVITRCPPYTEPSGEIAERYIWREGIVHDVVTRLDISCSEATHELKVNFPFLPATEDGGWTVSLWYEPIGPAWEYVPDFLDWSGNPSNSATMRVSDVSADYTIEWSVEIREDAENHYVANYGWRDGIYAGETHELQPADFTTITYDYGPLEVLGAESLFISTGSCWSARISWGGPRYWCPEQTLSDDPLPLDTIDQEHYIPVPYEGYWLGYVQRYVSDETGSPLVTTPWGRVEADGSFHHTAISYFYETAVNYDPAARDTLFVSADGRVPVGLAPIHWGGLFYNSATTVRVIQPVADSYWSDQAGGARTDLGDPPQYALDCPEGVDWNPENWSQCAAHGEYTEYFDVTEGEHSVRFLSPEYTVAEATGTVQVTAAFSSLDGQGAPKNNDPPAITGFGIEQNAMPTDELPTGPGRQNRVVVRAADDECTDPPSVSISVDLGSGWTELDVEYDAIAQTYTADLGTFGFSSVGTLGSIRVIATECDANSVQMDVLPAFRIVYGDSDGDGCGDLEEIAMGFNPDAWYDVYDVPVPAVADPQPNGTKDRAVTMSDVMAVLFYVPTWPTGVCGDNPNGNGVDYDCDKDGNTVPDGRDYDRTPSTEPNPPWDAGPPDGAISMADVLAVLAQVGLSCSGPP